jgi:superfamily II DNA or RNA helicase
MKELFPAQSASLARLDKLIRERSAALDASETGTGKTVKSVRLALASGRPVVVVCPKIVVPSWLAELAENGITPLWVGTYEKLRRGVPGVVTKARTKTYRWVVPPDTLVIWDEVHKSKGTASQNAAMLAAAKPLQNLLLSATPFDNPTEMRSIGYVLGLHRLEDFYPWAMRHGCIVDGYRKLVLERDEFGDLHENAKAGIERLAAKIAQVSDRVAMRDMPMAFRENLVITDPIDFKDSAKIAKAYAEVGDELAIVELLKEGDKARAEERAENSEAQATLSPLTLLLRARQKSELLKVPDIVEMAQDAFEEGKSVTVFVNFVQTLEAIRAKIGIECVEIRGGQSATLREEAIRRFQADEVRIVLCIVSAGGVGVSLHDTHGNHPRVSLISPTFNAKEFKQVLGRIYRVGLQSDVIQRVLVAEGTVEARVMKFMEEKLETAGGMLADTGAAETTTQAVEEQPAHAEFGPSGLKSIKVCPGFENTGGTSAAADMGTRCHLAMETGDDGPLQNDYEQHLVAMCRTGEQAITELHFPHGFVSEITELRMQIELPHGCSTFGTSDKLYMRGGLCVQIDYKFGKMPVDEPESNWQAKAYSLGTFQMFPEIEEIHFYFLQPQLDTISHGVFRRSDMPRLQQEIAEIILAAKSVREMRKCGQPVPEHLLNPTPGTCDYCFRNATCAAVTRRAVEVAQAYTGTPAQQALVHGSQINDAELLAEHLAWAPILEVWAKGIRKRSIEFIEQGGEIPGYELTQRSGGRKVDNPLMATEIAASFGIKAEDILRLASIPWTALEALVAESAKRGQKKKAVEEFEASLFGRGGLTYQQPVTQLKRTKKGEQEDE